MKVVQSRWYAGTWARGHDALGGAADCVLVFGATEALAEVGWLAELRAAHPGAILFGCSTAGEIAGTSVHDGSIVATAIRFERATVRGASLHIAKGESSVDVGCRLGAGLEKEGLSHVLVLCDGLSTNGSDLARGLVASLPPGVAVTGGLAGDGARFGKTLVLVDDVPEERCAAVLGLYGDGLRVGYGSFGGWDSFGPERLVTRAHGNVVHELDGQPALALYRRYLGDHAAGLPASGLRFPLCVRTGEGDRGVVRTILAMNEEEQSVTFAGDVPEGAFARLMHANIDRLLDGATEAARTSGVVRSELALLISCVGRKLVLQQRVEEEVEHVREVLGEGAAIAGFYSYGEICPHEPGGASELHNQTMTITTLAEA